MKCIPAIHNLCVSFVYALTPVFVLPPMLIGPRDAKGVTRLLKYCKHVLAIVKNDDIYLCVFF